RRFCPTSTPCFGGLETPLVTNTWDLGSHGMGRLSSVVDESGQTDFVYNAAGRLQSEAHARVGLSAPVRVGNGYYPGGLLQHIEYPPQVAGGAPQVVTFGLGADDEV